MPDSRARFPLLAVGILSLLVAMWGGLVRIGWNFPPLVPEVTGIHGPLMVSGFLGTLVSLERAVALRARWPFAAPVFTALGALVLMTGLSTTGGALSITLGSLGLVAIFGVIVRRQPALYTATMALGALAWLLGNLIWLAGLPVFRVVLWWSSFLILTVVGERLELARLRRLSRASEGLFTTCLIILIAGLIVDAIAGLAFPTEGITAGIRLAGAGMLALAVWLGRYDIARRTVRQSGLTRFIALCLLLGYVWLAIGGVLRVIVPDVVTGGLYYDAMLHTVLVGFILSMIFGHAPIILPAVLGRAMPYDPSLYAHLVLLHLSLILRITGDLGAGLAIRQWGGMLNVIAVLLFLFSTGRALRAGWRAPDAQAMRAA